MEPRPNRLGHRLFSDCPSIMVTVYSAEVNCVPAFQALIRRVQTSFLGYSCVLIYPRMPPGSMPVQALLFIAALPVMVNFQDPNEIARDFCASSFLVWFYNPKFHWAHHSAVTLLRVQNVADGIYMWVFILPINL